jgi:hypothetical protein
MNQTAYIRKSCCFEILSDSRSGRMAVWDCEIYPSEHFPAQLSRFPGDIVLSVKHGQGLIEIQDAGTYALNPGSVIQIRANERFWIRNALRQPFKFLAVLEGQTGAEAFFNVLTVTNDETEWVKQAEALGLELYLPEEAPEKCEAIKAAEFKIAWPLGAGFGI